MKQLDNLEEKVFNLELTVKELRETIEDEQRRDIKEIAEYILKRIEPELKGIVDRRCEEYINEIEDNVSVLNALKTIGKVIHEDRD